MNSNATSDRQTDFRVLSLPNTDTQACTRAHTQTHALVLIGSYNTGFILLSVRPQNLQSFSKPAQTGSPKVHFY